MLHENAARARRIWIDLGDQFLALSEFVVLLSTWPGFGAAGPFGSYAPFGDLSNTILTALLFLSRLEIIPLTVLVSRTYWRA